MDSPTQLPKAPVGAPSRTSIQGTSDTADTPQSPPPPQLAEPVRTYRKRKGTEVFAIQLNLDIESFTYHKWGGLQTCRSGDWIVERNGSVHTVAADSFARTYKQVGPATYVKRGVVWAAPASRAGAIATQEGFTHVKSGDFLVWNDKELQDGYAIAKDTFASLYEPAPAPEEATEPLPADPEGS